MTRYRVMNCVRLFRFALLRGCGILGLMCSLNGVHAQTYPLSENRWDNPEFVKRFLGSYGFLTEREPQITTKESDLFKTIADLHGAGQAAQAITTLRGAISPDSSAALDYTLGNLLLQGGDTDGAVTAYKEAIRKFPNFTRAYKNLGLAYVHGQRYEDAAGIFAKAVELGNFDGDTMGLLGYCYLNMDRVESALDSYRIAAVLAPNNRDWAVGKATALQRSGMYREAIAQFEELILRYPDSKAYYSAAANAHLALGEDLKSVAYLDLLRRRGDADNSVLMLLGDILVNNQMHRQAVSIYTDALAKAKDSDLDRILRFVRALSYQGANKEARDFVSLIRKSPVRLDAARETQLLNMESQIALALGDSEKAVAVLEELTRSDPLNGEALLLLGGHYFETGDNERAVFYFERAEKLDNHKVDALIQLARVRVAQSRFDQAVRLLRDAQAIKFQPHVAEYLNAVENALKASL